MSRLIEIKHRDYKIRYISNGRYELVIPIHIHVEPEVIEKYSNDTKLTVREEEVLALYAQGFSSREIGERLFISPKSVDTHLRNMRIKFNAYSCRQLIYMAFKSGMLKVDEEL